MGKLLAIGEALIDMIPQDTGMEIKRVSAFAPVVGGAPANVCGAFARLGGKADLITKLGLDPFGDKIVEEFAGFGIGTDKVLRTNAASTSLAFVALKEDGNREFSFFRKPGADMLLEPDELEKDWFEDCYALHFCSVSLGDFPMERAHRRAVECARMKGAIISFDPNLRPQIWTGGELERIHAYMPKADILKVSDEELAALTGETDIELALDKLMVGDVKLLIYTEGAKGAHGYLRNPGGQMLHAFADAEKVQAIDTTGAGDAFIGSFLYQLSAKGVTKEDLCRLTEAELSEMLAFSNAYCGKSVMGKGAIASYPTMKDMQDFQY